MEDKTENTKRIAKNTMMLYIRMLFGMLVSLYTSRLILQTLGVEDYGIYNVVGGFVAMFSLISNSLSSSVSRFLTFELGRGNLENLKRVFSTSLLIHLGLALVVLILAESIGLWFLNTRMTIPDNRLYAANWVFQAAIFSFMFSLVSVPYNASIVSHEKMTAFAYIGIIDILMCLGVVLIASHGISGFDTLILFSVLRVLVSVFLQCLYLAYCYLNFEECRFHVFWDKKYWREMSGFAGWNFIGCTAGVLKEQGVNILLNIFIGPVVNAARGIANSVNTAVGSFVGNFMVALNPQIIKSYASGDYTYMFSLINRAARFSFYILLILALPILFEAEFILGLWLKEYPQHTVNFVRLILLLTMLDVLSTPLITLQMATGKIRDYQIAVGGMLLMNFPLSYLCLYLGYNPESTYIVGIFVSICCLLLRLFFLKKMTGLSIRQFLFGVCLNVAMVSLLSVIIPSFLYFSLDEGWIRFILVSLVCVINSSFFIYKKGCSLNERSFVKNKMLQTIHKFFG